MKTYLKDSFFRERLLVGIAILICDLLIFVSIRNEMAPNSFDMLSSIWIVGSCVMIGMSINSATKTFKDENHLVQLKSLGFTSNEVKHSFEHLIIISVLQLSIMRIIVMVFTSTFSIKHLLILMLASLSYTVILKGSIRIKT